MNQILYVENKKSGPVEIRKVIIFFAIAMIIFGIVLIGQACYSMFSQPQDKQQVPTIIDNPQVDIERNEDNILIKVTHTKPITKIVYQWNDETEKTIEGNNRTEILEEITLPFGTNTLNLTIIDQNGNETKYKKDYVVDGDGKPVVELLVTNDNRIRIKVQDTISLNNMRYTWNNGEYVTIEANADNPNAIEQLIDIPLGQNTLKVEAVNNNNLVTTKELEVKGVKRPAVTLRQDGNKLLIRAEDENAMKLVTYTLNGKKYQINFGEVKVIEYAQELQQGENIIDLVAENKDGGITEIKGGKCIVE